ncbi:MAG: peptidylprolyl isomerase [Actinobacteria bacterium]|nr:peptidylprolyl isomerase [Actinomycetota bacterium]
MPNNKRGRTGISKQERQVRQSQARHAQLDRKRRRGFIYVVTIAIVVILFGFGVLGQNLRGSGDEDKTTPTTDLSQVSCPQSDGSSPRQLVFARAPGRCIDASKVYEAVIKTTAGTLKAELYPAKAFNAVNNFVFLSRWHFYDGLPFHRVLKDTIAQTGDPVAPGITGPGYEFRDDGLPASSAEYVKGALVFAHPAANQNGSQVLIILGPSGATLPPTFPLFGQVTSGMDVLARINRGAGEEASKPSARYNVISIDVTARGADK